MFNINITTKPQNHKTEEKKETAENRSNIKHHTRLSSLLKMVQTYDYALIITLFLSSVDALSQQHNNNISFGSVLRNNLISNNNANVGTNTNKIVDDDDDDDDANNSNNSNHNNDVINRGWPCEFKTTTSSSQDTCNIS